MIFSSSAVTKCAKHVLCGKYVVTLKMHNFCIEIFIRARGIGKNFPTAHNPKVGEFKSPLRNLIKKRTCRKTSPFLFMLRSSQLTSNPHTQRVFCYKERLGQSGMEGEEIICRFLQK